MALLIRPANRLADLNRPETGPAQALLTCGGGQAVPWTLLHQFEIICWESLEEEQSLSHLLLLSPQLSVGAVIHC